MWLQYFAHSESESRRRQTSGLRDDLPTFLGRDQGNNTRWDCLGYPIQFPVQSNNNTVRPRLIYNMTFP
jgi:hypothetical protein